MLSTAAEENKIMLSEIQRLTTLAAYRTASTKLSQVFVNQNLHVIKKCSDLKSSNAEQLQQVRLSLGHS